MSQSAVRVRAWAHLVFARARHVVQWLRKWATLLIDTVPFVRVRQAYEPQRPPTQGLILAGGLLIIYPQSDWLTALITDELRWPYQLAYGIWIIFDVAIVAVLFASARMMAEGRKFVGMTLALDLALAAVYWAYYTHEWINLPWLMALEALLALSAFGLIVWAMHVRVGGERSLFVSVAPLLVGVFVSFAASSIAILAQCSAHGCTDRTTLEQIPLIDKEFYSLAAQVLPALLIALAVEARAPVLPRQGVGSVPTYSESASGERALLGVSVLTFAVGAGAALAALASNRENLPLTFQLSVQAIGLGFAAIFVVAIRRNDATV